MKASILLLTIGILFFTFKVDAQSRFYVATEANFIHDLYQVTDEGGAVNGFRKNIVSLPGGTFIAGYELNPVINLEAGIAFRPATIGYRLEFDDGNTLNSSSGSIYYHIPIRTRARIPLLGDWLYATASIGAHLSMTDPTRVGIEEESASVDHFTTSNGGVNYSASVDYTSYNKYFITAAAETGFDFQINPKFKIYSTLTYTRGFTKLDKSDVTYQFQNEPEGQATVFHEGSYLSATIGLRFHFDTI